MSELVRITIEDHVAHVRLNRPDKLNALSPAMFEAIIQAAHDLRGNTDVRAVVISGEGRGFCAGLDLANFAEPSFINDFFTVIKPATGRIFISNPGMPGSRCQYR